MQFKFLRKFGRDVSGNVALTFGIASPVVVTAVAAGISYSTLLNDQASAQAILDSAMLTLPSQSGANNATLNGLVGSMLNRPQLTLSSTTLSSATGTNGESIFIGTATFATTSGMFSALGLANQSITVSSKVSSPAKIQTVNFQPTNVQGAYSKDVFVFTRDKTGAITWQQNVMTYRYTNAGGGTKTVTPNLLAKTSTFTIPSYVSFGVGMVIYEDLTYKGKLTNPKTEYSDVNSATFLQTSGKCSDPTGARYNWEDGGDSNFMDFVFNMFCTVGSDSSSSISLVQ